jgi:formate dehydrogenase maturation protein FdhE
MARITQMHEGKVNRSDSCHWCHSWFKNALVPAGGVARGRAGQSADDLLVVFAWFAWFAVQRTSGNNELHQSHEYSCPSCHSWLKSSCQFSDPSGQLQPTASALP